MTVLCFHKQDINKLIEMFNTSIKHSYLQTYLEDPLVDKDQVAFLLYMLEEKNLDSTYVNQCIIATLLVQAALDTHEKVNDETLTGDLSTKKRQLTVLAGDYYSSLYYYILSKINDVALIQLLAKSIQQINEAKMNMYKDGVKHVRASKEDAKVIDSALLSNIANHHQLPEWAKLVEEFFYFKRLVNARNTWKSSGVKEGLIDILWKSHTSKEEAQFSSFLDEQISLSKEAIFQNASHLNRVKDKLETRVDEILQGK